MAQHTFRGSLIKYVNVGGDAPHIKAAIKVVSQTPKMFMGDFEKVLGVGDISRFFEAPTLWDKISFSLSLMTTVKFDQLSFGGTLTEIVCKRKPLNEEENDFEFTLTFTKEIDQKDDSVFVTAYLKHKEENEEGKLVPWFYDVEIGK